MQQLVARNSTTNLESELNSDCQIKGEIQIAYGLIWLFGESKIVNLKLGFA